MNLFGQIKTATNESAEILALNVKSPTSSSRYLLMSAMRFVLRHHAEGGADVLSKEANLKCYW